jgi:transcriptional regulator with XRE-family HTH domain
MPVKLTIKKLLKQKGWTLEDLAKETGFSASHLSFIQRGKANTKLKTLLIIANALEVNIRDLFADPNEEETEYSILKKKGDK